MTRDWTNRTRRVVRRMAALDSSVEVMRRAVGSFVRRGDVLLFLVAVEADRLWDGSWRVEYRFSGKSIVAAINGRPVYSTIDLAQDER